MRPQSIVMFERLLLGSLALSAIGYIVSHEAMAEALTRDPVAARLGLGEGFVVWMFVIETGIFLLLWFLIARKAVNAAKWVLVALLVLSLFSLLPALQRGFALDLATVLNLSVYALKVAAAVHLFRDDAKAWLKGNPNTDSTTSD